MERLGVKVELFNIGKQQLPNGTEIDLPPILFGVLGADKSKKTVLIYGHLDVQPASKGDGWQTEPFTLVEKVNFHFILPLWELQVPLWV